MNMELLLNKKPQLNMYRSELVNLPPLEITPGYTLRTFQPGDEAAWEAVIKEAFNYEYSFQKTMAEDKAFRHERIFFIFYGDIPVATASAWHNPEKFGEDTGFLHYVGVLPFHSGKGLGRQITLATMYKMAEEGRKSAVLETDDFRIPAIIVYLKLGYKPKIVHENQIERWKYILEGIGRQDLIKELPQ